MAAVRDVLASDGRTLTQGALAHGPLPADQVAEVERLLGTL
ncbi:hypothetical protein [Plantactinospora sp. KLBMP9567]|nr:hypothetical protein [Plantactinospora sp. KLBMP9567]MDW5326031.1 hypothetical protein [Plantactinospora sp. KLBMP9567]